VCASAVVMLDTPCSEVLWRVLAIHFIRQFPLHFLTRASPCAITFQLDSDTINIPLVSTQAKRLALYVRWQRAAETPTCHNATLCLHWLSCYTSAIAITKSENLCTIGKRTESYKTTKVGATWRELNVHGRIKNYAWGRGGLVHWEQWGSSGCIAPQKGNISCSDNGGFHKVQSIHGRKTMTLMSATRERTNGLLQFINQQMQHIISYKTL